MGTSSPLIPASIQKKVRSLEMCPNPEKVADAMLKLGFAEIKGRFVECIS